MEGAFPLTYISHNSAINDVNQLHLPAMEASLELGLKLLSPVCKRNTNGQM